MEFTFKNLGLRKFEIFSIYCTNFNLKFKLSKIQNLIKGRDHKFKFILFNVNNILYFVFWSLNINDKKNENLITNILGMSGNFENGFLQTLKFRSRDIFEDPSPNLRYSNFDYFLKKLFFKLMLSNR